MENFKKRFQEWKIRQEAKGFKFYDKIEDININSNLKIGDKVIFTNEAGVSFGPYEVLCFCEPEGDGRCVYFDHDSYWYPARPENLKHDKLFYDEQFEILQEVAEELGWKVYNNENSIELSKYTSAGQDFNFSIDKNSILFKEIKEYHDSYDPAEETMKWVDSTGHGINGAPDNLQDILNDMEEVKQNLKKLYIKLRNGIERRIK